MSLKIRRGTTAERLAITPELAEPIWDRTLNKLYIGNGSTAGGVDVLAAASSAVVSVNTKVGTVVLTTDDIAEDGAPLNKWYTDVRAIDDIGLHLQSIQHDGIEFIWDALNHTITATVTGGAGGGLANIVEDTTPQLGGELDLNGQIISGTGTINITGAITATRFAGNLTTTGEVVIIDATAKKATLTELALTGSGVISGNQLNTSIPLINLFNQSASLTTPWITTISYSDAGDDSATGIVAMGKARGSVLSPANVASGDYLASTLFAGYNNTLSGLNGFSTAGSINVIVDGSVTSTAVPARLEVSVANSSGTLITPVKVRATNVEFTVQSRFPDGTAGAPSIAFTTDGGVDTGFSHPGDGVIVVSANATEVARFDGGGMRSSGFVKVADVNGTLPNPPEAGMIVLDGSTFKGYNGSAWVNLN